MTLREFHTLISKRLSSIYSAEECRALASQLLEHHLALPPYRLYTTPEAEIPQNREEELMTSLAELEGGVPIQYIKGYEIFCGHKFNLNRNVLIPRPETEELVALILDAATPGPLRIADICTGSGCIAWSLASALGERACVEGCDISPKALECARGQHRNFPQLRQGPEFYRCDILNGKLPEHTYDIIVANPPYVLESERAQMRRNVCGQEPDIALFVPDSDPLLFYRAIAERAAERLAPGGALYFEINERFGQETCRLLEEMGYTSVRVHKDLFGKERFTSARRR